MVQRMWRERAITGPNSVWSTVDINNLPTAEKIIDYGYNTVSIDIEVLMKVYKNRRRLERIWKGRLHENEVVERQNITTILTLPGFGVQVTGIGKIQHMPTKKAIRIKSVRDGLV